MAVGGGVNSPAGFCVGTLAPGMPLPRIPNNAAGNRPPSPIADAISPTLGPPLTLTSGVRGSPLGGGALVVG